VVRGAGCHTAFPPLLLDEELLDDELLELDDVVLELELDDVDELVEEAPELELEDDDDDELELPSSPFESPPHPVSRTSINNRVKARVSMKALW
jgi:hypothetical protein